MGIKDSSLVHLINCPDGLLIEEITVHDPVIFTKPVVITQYYNRFPDDELIDYECTDGPWRDYLRELAKQRTK